jgi:hypothetical protein
MLSNDQGDPEISLCDDDHGRPHKEPYIFSLRRVSRGGQLHSKGKKNSFLINIIIIITARLGGRTICFLHFFDHNTLEKIHYSWKSSYSVSRERTPSRVAR